MNRQLTIDSIATSEDELTAAYEEEVSMVNQLADHSRTGVLGYASNLESGFIALGWGDLELVDDAGAVRWLHWEDLPIGDKGMSGAVAAPPIPDRVPISPR